MHTTGHISHPHLETRSNAADELVRFMLTFFSQSDIAYIDITLAVELYSSSKVSSRELRCALLIAIVMTNVESMCD